MTTEKTSSPRRSGADWFGLIAFAVLVICSAVLVVRLISTKFLPTGQLLLAVGALLVLSGLHGWVQLPRREKTGGKIACGIVALVLAAAMLYGAVALGSVQHAITDVADKSVETDITCVIVNADDPAQSLDDVKGYRFGILEDRDTENTQSLLQQLQEKLRKNRFTLQDYYDQLQQIRNMGDLSQLAGMMPGNLGSKLQGAQIDEKAIAHTEAIILSMTPEERENPQILGASRKKRIAAGCGLDVVDVNRLLKQFEGMQQIIKQVTGGRKPGFGFGGLGHGRGLRKRKKK